jgi:PleD family two-component response regulator
MLGIEEVKNENESTSDLNQLHSDNCLQCNRILIIDDNSFNILALSMVLEAYADTYPIASVSVRLV